MQRLRLKCDNLRCKIYGSKFNIQKVDRRMTLIREHLGDAEVTHIYEVDKHNNITFVIMRNREPEHVAKLNWKMSDETKKFLILRRFYKIR